MRNNRKENNFEGKENLIFSILLFICLFLYLLYPYSDFDWGWHYRYGEYFFTHLQPLKSDPFSWTMTGYDWVNTSWLYDPIVYILFQKTGFFGLSIAGTLVSTLTFYFSVKSTGVSEWQKGLLAVFYFWLVKGVAWEGLRSQMLGLLFLSIFVYTLSRIGTVKRGIFLIPLLFLFWANIHGSFVLGLFIFGIRILTTFLVRQLQSKHFVLITLFALSVLVTFLNPLTYHNYVEIFHHFNNPLLKNIVEWMPVKFSLLTVEWDFFLAYLMLLGVGFWKRKSGNDVAYLVVAILFGYLAFTARRYWSIFSVVTLPFAAIALKSLFKNSDLLEKMFTIGARIGIIISLAIVILIKLPKTHVWSYSFDDYCASSSGCSEGLVQYLLKNPPIGQGLNKYSWGSYFIGRGVQTPLFIDGRMAIWRQNGFIPVKEYKQIYLLGDAKKFNECHFDWVIAGNDFLLLDTLKFSKALGDWTVVYSDDKASYLVRTQ